ncbi:trimeric intracellular cation channel family protein [Maritalea sp.]|uniref:trimeric intracellular cation channel family protein n=1 Tax=Maritalea sp. TaxID=2003361 RepID=UPI003EF0CE8D
MFSLPIYYLDLFGVAIFATTGALVASRKQLDIISFGLLATLTGVGGGTVRDLILDRPVFWIVDQTYLATCLAIAFVAFFTSHLIQRRYLALLWLDAVGLAAYGVLGAHIAHQNGAGFFVAIALGMMTATFGGMIRDVVCDENTLILQDEIYATAALLAAGGYIALIYLGVDPFYAAIAGTFFGFALRAGGIQLGWQIPRYKPREGREY